jgi:DNA-binding response OmpR family regulator
MRVLIIHDDADITAMFQQTLATARGDEVAIAADVSRAVDQVERDRPAVIFVGVGVGDYDGFAVVDQIRDRSTLSHIPIVMFGLMKPDEEERHRALLQSITYLPSPIEVTELLAARDRAVT